MDEPITHLQVSGLGQLDHAEIRIADLTVLVGPQATGKSLLLQTLKAAVDLDPTVHTLKQHGYAQPDAPAFFELLYGEGMSALAQGNVQVSVNGTPWDPFEAATTSWSKRSRRKKDHLFYIPAQRVLTLQEGWPTPFSSFPVGAPYVVKRFSEDLRRHLESDEETHLFPVERRFKKELRDVIDDTIFHGAQIDIDTKRLRKRFLLNVRGASLPFMSWSAGQREFIPLMLGLYKLMPSQGSDTRKPYQYVVLEEPEMGLHPAAISGVLLLVLDLMKRGYKVVLSTHSPHVLEAVWAVQRLQQGLSHDPNLLARLFDVSPTEGLRVLASATATATFSVTALTPHPAGVRSTDITSLDPDAEEPLEANWGGITTFADRAAELVRSTRLFSASAP